jgi:hypothetical protein
MESAHALRHAPMKTRLARLVPVAAALGLASGVCPAESGDPLTDRFSVSLGTFFLDTSTTVRVDGASQRGTEVDLERDLGLGNVTRFRADAYWRFKKRHKLRVMYFDTRQSESRQINREIVFRGTTYPVNAQVDAHFDTTVAELAYEYAFLRRETWQLAGSIGVHTLKFDVGLSTSGSTQSVPLSQSATATGPLPVVGLHGVWRFTDWLYADAQAQFFKISISPYDGRLEDYMAALVWQPFRHVALGAGYNYFVTRLDVSGDRFAGHMRWQYGGARVFINASY